MKVTKLSEKLISLTIIVCAAAVFQACSGPAKYETSSQEANYSSESEFEFGVLDEALANIPRCTTAASTACWENKGDIQQFSFTYLQGYRFYVHAIDPKLVRRSSNSATEPVQGSPIGVASHPGGLPASVLSLTSFMPAAVAGTISALTADNVTYQATGSLPPNANQFTTWTVAVEAKKTDGSSICLSEIENMVIGYPQPGSILVGLSCDGKLYYATGGRWKSLQSHSAGYATLPTAVTYKHISRSSTGGTFLTTANAIWLAGQGLWNGAALVWSAPKQLPTPKDPQNNTLGIKTAGGQYIITTKGNGDCPAPGEYCNYDADRIYRYDGSSNSWKRFVPSVPWVPGTNQDGYCDTTKFIGQCTPATADDQPNVKISGGYCPYPEGMNVANCCCRNGFPFFDGIQEVLVGGIAVHHVNSWGYRYRP